MWLHLNCSKIYCHKGAVAISMLISRREYNCMFFLSPNWWACNWVPGLVRWEGSNWDFTVFVSNYFFSVLTERPKTGHVFKLMKALSIIFITGS